MQQETHLAICSHWPFAIVPIETCTKSAHLKIYTCNGYSPTRHANHSVHVVIGWTAHLPLSQSTVFTVTASCIHRCTVTVGIQKWCVHRDKYTMQTNYTNACYITNILPALCNNQQFRSFFHGLFTCTTVRYQNQNCDFDAFSLQIFFVKNKMVFHDILQRHTSLCIGSIPLFLLPSPKGTVLLIVQFCYRGITSAHHYPGKLHTEYFHCYIKCSKVGAC